MSDDENDAEDSEDEGSAGMSEGEAGQPQRLAGKASGAAAVAAEQVCAWCSLQAPHTTRTSIELHSKQEVERLPSPNPGVLGNLLRFSIGGALPWSAVIAKIQVAPHAHLGCSELG